jgi:hypothetical protein
LDIPDTGTSARPLGEEFESTERRADQLRNGMGQRWDGKATHILSQTSKQEIEGTITDSIFGSGKTGFVLEDRREI